MSEVDTSTVMTGHAYDGIQEYDNPLPGWWTMLFIGTFLFSILYWLYFHTGAPNRSMIDQLTASETRLAEKNFKTLGDLQQDRATILRFSKDPEWTKYGASIFRTNCQSCHGPEGGGLVGPNLTDDKWKNVKHVEDIMTVINNGAGGNAMPAWKQRFRDPRDVIMVGAYVASLLDAVPKPANAKAPEGATTIASWADDAAAIPAEGQAAPEAAKGEIEK